MIVVINPSGGAGQSFKGLNAYCNHDQGSAASAERVDWSEARNIATNDPNQVWKIMAATAQIQNELKAGAGIKAGRPSKHGPVMHVVLSFDKDEPQTRESMNEAANEFLSKLGVDPAKSRAKNKPKRRQFANEHQVMIYAHNDGTSGTHLHLMINRVHPETGLNLPSNNDQIKASKWALDYSKRHGTDHKTPARSENMADREAGQYVKAQRRKSRNLYERDKALGKMANDNDRLQIVRNQQRKKDAALALRGRNLVQLQSRGWDKLAKGHQTRKEALGRELKREINKAKAAIRETFRPLHRALKARQRAEQRTFDGLESSFFGKASNIVKTVKLSGQLLRDDKSNIITRSFKILTNAGARKDYFEKAQNRARIALERKHENKASQACKALKTLHEAKLAKVRAVFIGERTALNKKHDNENAKLKSAWNKRAVDRETAYLRLSVSDEKTKQFKNEGKSVKVPSPVRSRVEAALSRMAKQAPFDERRSPVKEQDNSKNRDDERER